MQRDTLRSTLLAMSALVAMTSVSAAQQVIEGRLEDGDQQSDMWEYFDVYPFDGVAGQAWQFEVKSPDFLPGGMLIDPSGKQVYKQLGNASDKVWGTQCSLPVSGEWQLVVFQSFWQEGDYTLTVDDASSADVPVCGEY